jgi:hypothetical protein
MGHDVMDKKNQSKKPRKSFPLSILIGLLTVAYHDPSRVSQYKNKKCHSLHDLVLEGYEIPKTTTHRKGPGSGFSLVTTST